MSRGYVTADRLAQLERNLSDLDRVVISDVDRLGVVTGRQIRQLHYEDSSSGRRLCRLHLNRLVDRRGLQRLGRRVGGVRAGSEGFAYGLDVAGWRLVDPERSRWWRRRTPGESHLAHALAVSDLYVELRDAERSGDFELVTFDAEPRCWRRYHGPGGARATLRPDAFVVIRSGEFEDHFFIELDRGTEWAPRIAEKGKAFLRYFQSGREQAASGVFPLVLWITPDEKRQAAVAKTVASVAAAGQKIHLVVTTGSAVAAITEQSPSDALGLEEAGA